MPDRHTLGEDALRQMQLEHEQDVVARMVPRQRIPEALFVSAEEENVDDRNEETR